MKSQETLYLHEQLAGQGLHRGVLSNQDVYLITESEDAVIQEHLMTIDANGYMLLSIQRFAKMPGFDTLSMEATAQILAVRGRAKAGNQSSTVFFYDRRPSDGVIAPSWTHSGEFTATSLVEVLGENYLYTAQAEEKPPVSLYTIGPLKLRVSTPEALTDGLLTFNGISQGQTRNLRITDLYLTPQEQIEVDKKREEEQRKKQEEELGKKQEEEAQQTRKQEEEIRKKQEDERAAQRTKT